MLKTYFPACEGERSPFIPSTLKEYPSSQVFIYDMPSARQNIIMTFQNTDKVKGMAEIAPLKLFGEYFGGGMYSILFQEMREFRSFAYASYGSPVLISGNVEEAPA